MHVAEDKNAAEMDETHSSDVASNGKSSSSVASNDSGVGALHSTSTSHVNKELAVHTL
jgi:hypothetical protein